MEDIRQDFSLVTWLLIPIAIAANVVVGQLLAVSEVPLYLDSIGTIFVGLVAGPWAGALTGLLANLIWGVSG